jgi:hypothetical protein
LSFPYVWPGSSERFTGHSNGGGHNCIAANSARTTTFTTEVTENTEPEKNSNGEEAHKNALNAENRQEGPKNARKGMSLSLVLCDLCGERRFFGVFAQFVAGFVVLLGTRWQDAAGPYRLSSTSN